MATLVGGHLCFTVLGRDINKIEIPLADNRSMLFSIRPVRIIDDSNTNDFDNVSEMSDFAVSLDDTDAYIYLSPFLDKYFDAELEENKKRGFAIWDRLAEEISPTDLIVDFYRRLIYRLEYMLTVGKENGFNLISFMGP